MEDLKSQVLKVREEYQKLVDEYEKEYGEYKSFGETVRSKVYSVRIADYPPQHRGDFGYMSHRKNLEMNPVDPEIINGARKHAINRMIY